MPYSIRGLGGDFDMQATRIPASRQYAADNDFQRQALASKAALQSMPPTERQRPVRVGMMPRNSAVVGYSRGSRSNPTPSTDAGSISYPGMFMARSPFAMARAISGAGFGSVPPAMDDAGSAGASSVADAEGYQQLSTSVDSAHEDTTSVVPGASGSDTGGGSTSGGSTTLHNAAQVVQAAAWTFGLVLGGLALSVVLGVTAVWLLIRVTSR